MSRMSELAWALEGYDEDRDLEMAAFHQYELEMQQREQEMQCPRKSLPGSIHPRQFLLSSSLSKNSSMSGPHIATTFKASWLPKKS